jgi:hypothetical protein
MRSTNEVGNSNINYENSDVLIEGSFSLEYLDRTFQKRKIEVAPQLEWFDSLWSHVSNHLQDPIQNEGVDRFSGYTGHRTVILPGRMGKCALGFHLLRVGGDDYRTMTAFRRKIYASERRRRFYTSDSLYVSSSEIISYSYSPRIEHDMGVMESWIDAYESAENPHN